MIPATPGTTMNMKYSASNRSLSPRQQPRPSAIPAGGMSSRAIRAPTGASCIRCAPRACTAGPPAARGVPGPRTSRFHDSAAAAERAGFRPCLRCQPSGPALAERQAAVVDGGLSPHRARRVDADPRRARAACRAERIPFPPRLQGRHRADAARLCRGAHRDRRLRERLVNRGGATDLTVTDAIYDAGFNSSGRAYAAADAALGMTPAALSRGRHGGADPLRRRRVFARLDPGGAERPRAVRDPARRRSRRAGARPAGSLSRRPR